MLTTWFERSNLLSTHGPCVVSKYFPSSQRRKALREILVTDKDCCVCVCQCMLLFRSERCCDTPVSRLNVTLEISARTCQTRSSRTGSTFFHLHSSDLIWSYLATVAFATLIGGVLTTESDGKQTARSGGGHSQQKKIFLSEWMREQNKSEVSSFALFTVKNHVVSNEWINIVVEYNCNYNCIYILRS